MHVTFSKLFEVGAIQVLKTMTLRLKAFNLHFSFLHYPQQTQSHSPFPHYPQQTQPHFTKFKNLIETKSLTP